MPPHSASMWGELPWGSFPISFFHSQLGSAESAFSRARGLILRNSETLREEGSGARGGQSGGCRRNKGEGVTHSLRIATPE
jgi:hypothetical protein